MSASRSDDDSVEGRGGGELEPAERDSPQQKRPGAFQQWMQDSESTVLKVGLGAAGVGIAGLYLALSDMIIPAEGRVSPRVPKSTEAVK